ncbi:hypothetical protein [Frigoriglobus tundricola]|uniref:Uncharacterized protein n=1 Tax=Frigoriglobus tundricola TaxID=2774151 RepID=A0A6M5YS41_9BACT|nr:hypothetical protein [Frigoriglobus tundricola]QJW96234.1 hypothetical protein FTUN_3791 [Frigoriglobus tundricola]
MNSVEMDPRAPLRDPTNQGALIHTDLTGQGRDGLKGLICEAQNRTGDLGTRPFGHGNTLWVISLNSRHQVNESATICSFDIWVPGEESSSRIEAWGSGRDAPGGKDQPGL